MERFASSNSKFKSLAELIRFNEENSDEVLTHFGHEIFLDSLKAIDRNKYEKSKNFVVMRARDQINNLIDTNNFDEVINFAKEINKHLIITRGEKGAISVLHDKISEIGVKKNLNIRYYEKRKKVRMVTQPF